MKASHHITCVTGQTVAPEPVDHIYAGRSVQTRVTDAFWIIDLAHMPREPWWAVAQEAVEDVLAGCIVLAWIALALIDRNLAALTGET